MGRASGRRSVRRCDQETGAQQRRPAGREENQAAGDVAPAVHRCHLGALGQVHHGDLAAGRQDLPGSAGPGVNSTRVSLVVEDDDDRTQPCPSASPPASCRPPRPACACRAAVAAGCHCLPPRAGEEQYRSRGAGQLTRQTVRHRRFRPRAAQSHLGGFGGEPPSRGRCLQLSQGTNPTGRAAVRRSRSVRGPSRWRRGSGGSSRTCRRRSRARPGPVP